MHTVCTPPSCCATCHYVRGMYRTKCCWYRRKCTSISQRCTLTRGSAGAGAAAAAWPCLGGVGVAWVVAKSSDDVILLPSRANSIRLGGQGGRNASRLLPPSVAATAHRHESRSSALQPLAATGCADTRLGVPTSRASPPCPCYTPLLVLCPKGASRAMCVWHSTSSTARGSATTHSLA